MHTEDDSRQSLELAISEGNIDIVSLLIKHGADANIKNENGETPLHETAERGHIDIASLLIKHGADVNIKNKDGKTAIELAQQEGYTDIVNTITEAIEARAQAE